MKTAVVTGASGGIGLETARALLADGWQVVCLSRHACPLEGVRSIPCDITDRAQVQAAFAAVDRVDLLVNNAGFGISGAVECTGEAEMRRQFDLNFFAWVTVIQAALPALRPHLRQTKTARECSSLSARSALAECSSSAYTTASACATSASALQAPSMLSASWIR